MKKSIFKFISLILVLLHIGELNLISQESAKKEYMVYAIGCEENIKIFQYN